MKRFLKSVCLYCLFTIFLSTISAGTHAQGGPGGGGGIGDPACDPQCNCRPDGSICPIDDGLYLLLFIGMGYGFKKLRDSRRTNLSNSDFGSEQW